MLPETFMLFLKEKNQNATAGFNKHIKDIKSRLSQAMPNHAILPSLYI